MTDDGVTDDGETARRATDHGVVLPRFGRDVRVLNGGPAAGAAGAARGSSRPGVLGSFTGLLQPGLATGQWPPPALSHLALADVLAGALGRPGPLGESPAPADRSASSDEPGTADEEPTVREVLHRTDDEDGRELPGSRSSATGDATADAGDAHDPVAMEPRDWSPAHRAGPRDPTGERASTDRPATGGRPSVEAPAGSGAGESGGDGRVGDADPTGRTGTGPASIVEPRTVLRQVRPGGNGRDGDRRAAGGPAEAADDESADAPAAETGPPLPGRAPTSITRPRTVLRQVGPDPERASGGGASGAGRSATGSETADGPTGGPPPVDLTVADAPPDVGAMAAMVGDAHAERPGRSPSSPRGAPGESTVTGATPDASGPSMTVRHDRSGGAGPAGRESGGDAPGGRTATAPGERGGDDGRSTGATPGDTDGVAGPEGTVSLADLGETAGGAAGEVERVIERAVERPRVIDRLTDAIDRRRRIERERGGRR